MTKTKILSAEDLRTLRQFGTLTFRTEGFNGVIETMTSNEHYKCEVAVHSLFSQYGCEFVDNIQGHVTLDNRDGTPLNSVLSFLKAGDEVNLIWIRNAANRGLLGTPQLGGHELFIDQLDIHVTRKGKEFWFPVHTHYAPSRALRMVWAPE